MLKDTNLGDLEGTTWLISGGGGFIGSYFLILSVCNEGFPQTLPGAV